MANPDGSLGIRLPWDRTNPGRWVEIDPLVFERVGEEGRVVFREDSPGRITGLYAGIGSFQAVLEKLAWYETTAIQVELIRLFEFIFLTACVGWPLEFLIRRWKKRATAAGSRAARIARFWAGGVSLLNTSFLIGLVLTPSKVDLYEFTYGLPGFFAALLVLPVVSAALSAALPVFTVLAWKKRHWSVVGQVHYSLVNLAALAFILFLDYWNLLGFRY